MHGILFANGSEFQTKLFRACNWTRGNTEPWHEGEGGYTRRVTYLTSPSTLIKGVKATEIQVRSWYLDRLDTSLFEVAPVDTLDIGALIGGQGSPQMAKCLSTYKQGLEKPACEGSIRYLGASLWR